MEGPLLWVDRKSRQWVGGVGVAQKSSCQLWLSQIDSLFLSLSFHICKWGAATSLPISVLLWGLMNTADCGCVWVKFSIVVHLEVMTVPTGSLWHPQRVVWDDRYRQKAR